MDEYKDEVIGELIKFIEAGEEIIKSGSTGVVRYCDRRDISNTETKLLEFFNGDERVLTCGTDQWEETWGHYYILLEDNSLLTIAFNNFGKYDNVPTRFCFGIYPKGDKCFFSYVPNPGAYSCIYQIRDGEGKDIDEKNSVYILDGTYQDVLLKDLVKPISLEEIKERAKGSMIY